MAQDKFVIHNRDSFNVFFNVLQDFVKSDEPFVCSIKTHKNQSISQRALLHIWIREYAKFITPNWNQFESNEQTKLERATKLSIKRRAYGDNHWPWLLDVVTDVFTGKESTQATSSESWSQGECYQFMEWLQIMAGIDGLILEAKGEFKNLRESQNV